jgi:threonine dehydrogenase-like Zn-dependent dehydrogenase
MQMPERHVFHLPDNLSMDEGALIEPASIAYDAFRGVTLSKDDTAVVYGTGAIGMVAAWLAKYYGAGEVILVGRSDDKLAVGLQIGADHVINSKKEDAIARIKELSVRGKGADLVIETSGAASALRDSIACTARYGRISIVSFYERNIDDLPIDPLVLGCMSMVGAAGRYGNAPEVCEIMSKNPVKLTPVFTHHIPFEDTLDVFENEEKYHATKIKAMIAFD